MSGYRTENAIKVKQEPIKILSGTPRPDDGRVFREDFGLPLTDSQYDYAVKEQAAAAARTEEYRSQASKQLDESTAAARKQISEAKGSLSIPGFQKPEEDVIWASGDGDKATKYTVPNSATADILKGMTDNGYYHYEKLPDGSYSLMFGEYGKEGYEAMNDVQRQYNTALSTAKADYDSQVADARTAFKVKQTREIMRANAALDETYKGTKAAIDDQYNYLTSIFGQEMSALSQDWQKRKAENSQAVINLVNGGVLTPKKVKVLS